MFEELITQAQTFLSGVPPWLYAILAGGAVAGWDRIKNWGHQLSTHLVESVEMDGDLSGEFLSYLSEIGSTSPFGSKGYLVISEKVRSKRKQMWLLARWVPQKASMTVWIPHPWFPRLKAPVWIGREDSGVAMVFRFIRGTIKVEDTLRQLVEKVNSRTQGRYRVIRCTGAGHQSGGDKENRRTNTVSANNFTRLPATAFYVDVDGDDIGDPKHQGAPEDLWWGSESKPVLDDAKAWIERRAWYHDRGIPWRRGYLLNGVPGTGKTSLARALAIALDIPLYSVDLGSMSNLDVSETWESVRQNTPAVVLIEDIDSVYVGRTPVHPNQQMGLPPTFDALLNCIDGANPNDGVLTVITTNNLSAVDIALGGERSPSGEVEEGKAGRRPGRVDKVVHLPSEIDLGGARFLAEKMLEGPEQVEKALTQSQGCTPAMFVEKLVLLAQEDS